MGSTRVYLENGLDVSLHVHVRAEDGVLCFTLYGQRTLDTEPIAAGKTAFYDVNDAIRACFDKNERLAYEIRNKTGMSIVFTGGREKMPDGPILKIEPQLN